MSFRRLILVMTIAILALMIGLLSFSYAWYGLTTPGTTFNTVTSNDLSTEVSVVYTQSDIVSITTGVPITSGEVATKSGKNLFTVYADPTFLTNYIVSSTISLVNITIDNALKVADFKYQLLENDVVIASGTGAAIGNNNKITLKNSTINIGVTYNYEFRIWLEESGVSQNTLMGKNFGAKISVVTAMKK